MKGFTKISDLKKFLEGPKGLILGTKISIFSNKNQMIVGINENSVDTLKQFREAFEINRYCLKEKDSEFIPRPERMTLIDAMDSKYGTYKKIYNREIKIE